MKTILLQIVTVILTAIAFYIGGWGNQKAEFLIYFSFGIFCYLVLERIFERRLPKNVIPMDRYRRS